MPEIMGTPHLFRILEALFGIYNGDMFIKWLLVVKPIIWVWVKIRYPNNWMVNTKLD